MNSVEIKTILRNHREQIKRFGVTEIGLFGSHVRGEARDDSDIDFLVVFERGKKTFDNFMDLHEYLERIYHARVDMVTPESLSKYIRPYVEKEAEYEKL